MSEDKKLLNSISSLLLDTSRPSPFAKINPSITDERRRELTRHALRSFAAEIPAMPELHKPCIDMQQALKHKLAKLKNHHEDLHRSFEELVNDYKQLSDEYIKLFEEHERLQHHSTHPHCVPARLCAGTAQTPENLEFQRRGALHSGAVVDSPEEELQYALSDGSSLEK
ncbi:hypothetical protein B0H13DRAFT_1884627 [Mycena leptocephala]|nr:hypothetical protein B0H13DRAFT_1884627 [Mycena leptocephala]